MRPRDLGWNTIEECIPPTYTLSWSYIYHVACPRVRLSIVPAKNDVTS